MFVDQPLNDHEIFNCAVFLFKFSAILLFVCLVFMWSISEPKRSKLFHAIMEKLNEKNSWKRQEGNVYKNGRLTVYNSGFGDKPAIVWRVDGNNFTEKIPSSEEKILAKEFLNLLKFIEKTESEAIAAKIV